jgi:hypothetical protein
MKKPKSNTKARIKTAEQPQEFIARKMRKMLYDCLDSEINDGFACEVILVIAGELLLARGDADAFQNIISQIIDKNQDAFEMNETDPDDDGTFH